MPGQRGSEKRQRENIVTIRLNDAEKKRLNNIAAHSGVSRAEVIRRMLVHDHSRILPSRKLTRNIVSLGVNVNQIAKALNGLNSRAGEAPGLRTTLARLDDLRLQMQTATRELNRIRLDMDAWR